jgi:hypothetical protein
MARRQDRLHHRRRDRDRRATAILFAREGAKWLLRARLRAKSGGITGVSEG